MENRHQLRNFFVILGTKFFKYLCYLFSVLANVCLLVPQPPNRETESESQNSLYKNSNLKTAAARPLTSHFKNHSSKTKKTRGAQLEKLGRIHKRGFFFLTPTHERASVGRPSKIFIDQLCTNTWCCLEDILRVMDDRDYRLRAEAKELRALSVTDIHTQRSLNTRIIK